MLQISYHKSSMPPSGTSSTTVFLRFILFVLLPFALKATAVTRSPTVAPSFSPAPSVSSEPTQSPSVGVTVVPSVSAKPTFAPTKIPCNISQGELTFLNVLYNTTLGPNWRWRPSETIWEFPASLSDPCTYSWQGVSCSPPSIGGHCRIVELRLAGYGLQGRIPSEISSMTALTFLQMSLNRLYSSIPKEISYLTSLESLFVASNFLSGKIPPEISCLTALSNIELYTNRLSGPLTEGLSTMVNLQYLQLYQNRLSQTLPSKIFKNITSLLKLAIGRNNFTGSIPSELSSLTDLTYLDLELNSFTGSIPSELSALKSLSEEFSVYKNLLTGQIPSGFQEFTKLTYLALDKNLFTGPIFNNISKLVSLVHFYAESNKLTSTIPDNISKLTNLVELYLIDNSLTGSIPSGISVLTNLQTLDLATNFLNGTISSGLSCLTNLQQVWLFGNLFSGSLPKELSTLVNLTELYLQSSHLTGHLPLEWSLMTSLEKLYLHQNRIEGVLPYQYSTLTNMVDLNLNSNLLSGSIPSQISTFKALEGLLLYNNFFNSTFPSELYSLTGLLSLQVSSNRLSGSLSADISNLIYVNQLWFYENKLTNSIPHEISNCRALVQLLLYSNFLNSSIPYQFSVLKNLTNLGLGLNSLSGFIPSQLSAMRRLQYLSLYSNNLIGEIPSQLSALVGLKFLALYDNMLSGSISAQFYTLSRLIQMSLNNNKLTSEIPTFIGNFENLHALILDNNEFEKTIPIEIGNLRNLSYLALGNNKLTGSIPPSLKALSSVLVSFDVAGNNLVGDPFFFGSGFSRLYSCNLASNKFDDLSRLSTFEAHSASSLAYLDISSNLFFGILPDNIGSAFPRLVYFKASYNCLDSHVPTSICDLKNISTILFDKLFISEEACKKSSKATFRNLNSQKNGDNTIPSCIWSLSSLKLAHFVSNRFFGTLGEVNQNGALMSISVVGNLLTGSIPKSIQSSSTLENVQLSLNRFSGTLESDAFKSMPSNSTLQLYSNRVSGILPQYLYNIDDTNDDNENNNNNNNDNKTSEVSHFVNGIDILSGNLFYCDKSPPSIDLNYQSYSCGSSQIDFYQWVYIVVLTMFALSLSIFFMKRKLFPTNAATQQQQQQHKFVQYYRSLVFPSNFFRSILKLRFLVVCSCLSLFSIIFNLLMRGEKSFSYNTTDQQYGWSSTFAFVHGVAPFVIVLLIVIITLFVFLYFVNTGPSSSAAKAFARRPPPPRSQSTSPSLISSTHTASVSPTSSSSTSTSSTSKSPSPASTSSTSPPYALPKIEIELVSSDSNNTGEAGEGLKIDDRDDTASIASPAPSTSKSSEVSTFRNHIVTKTNTNVDTSLRTDLEGNISTSSSTSTSTSTNTDSAANNDSLQSYTYSDIARFVALALINLFLITLLNVFYVLFVTETEKTSPFYVKRDYRGLFPILLSIFNMFLDVYSSISIQVGIRLKLSPNKLFLYYLFSSVYKQILVPILVVYFTSVNCFYYAVHEIPHVEESYTSISTEENCDITVYNQAFYAVRRYVTISLSIFSCQYELTSGVTTSLVTPSWIYGFSCVSSLLVTYIPAILSYYTIFGVGMPIVQAILLTFPRNSYIRRNIFVKIRVLPSTFIDEHLLLDESHKRFRTFLYLSKLGVDILMLFTFGIACGFLTFLIIFKILVTELMTHLQFGSYLQDRSKSGKEDLTYLFLVLGQYDTLYDEEFRKKFLSMVWKLLLFTVLLFWSPFMFDCVADVSSGLAGFIAVLCFWFFVLFLFSSKKRFKRAASRVTEKVDSMKVYISRSSLSGSISSFRNSRSSRNSRESSTSSDSFSNSFSNIFSSSFVVGQGQLESKSKEAKMLPSPAAVAVAVAENKRDINEGTLHRQVETELTSKKANPNPNFNPDPNIGNDVVQGQVGGVYEKSVELSVITNLSSSSATTQSSSISSLTLNPLIIGVNSNNNNNKNINKNTNVVNSQAVSQISRPTTISPAVLAARSRFNRSNSGSMSKKEDSDDDDSDDESD